jgi:hypothetical protein
LAPADPTLTASVSPAYRLESVLGLLIARYASADAATVHRATVDLRARQHVIVRPKGVAAPTRFGVPGWTDEQTQKWLDNACMYRKRKLGGNGDEVRRGWRVTSHRRGRAMLLQLQSPDLIVTIIATLA